MAIRMMVHCRKCNREFDWNNDEGYAKMPDGSYLCSISCDLKETLDKLALALSAIEAAKELIADEAWYVGELGEYCLGCCLNKKLGRHTSTCPISRFLEAVTKLEQSK